MARGNQGYTYKLTAPIGASFDTSFDFQLSPCEMLELGIMKGLYFNDDVLHEFPREW